MKALIVDDERLARLELRRLLAEHPEIDVAGEARCGEEALSMIPQLAPDLLFLDIQRQSPGEGVPSIAEAPRLWRWSHGER